MGLRQEKFARQVQKDVGDIFLLHRDWVANEFITISKVMVSPDLGHVKIYLSLFNAAKRKTVLETVEAHAKEIRHELARKIKNSVRKIPEIQFFEDDTMDYVVKMDKLFEDLKKDKPHSESDI